MSALDHMWAGWRRDYIESVSGPPELDGACVFCAILASGLPDEETHIVWRDPKGATVALLNAYPYASGHLMVMPLRHAASPEDLDPVEGEGIWRGAREAIQAIKAAYTPDGINLGANLGRSAGAGVPGHFHLHVLPRWAGDTSFMTSVADTRVLPEALSVSAAKVRSAWPAADAGGSAV
jgi:diadenosine tetraphosphate (Ap4A) HIT family hydrolase